MILNAIDRKIRQAFSDAAMQYDVLSSLQREIGRELVHQLSHPRGGTPPRWDTPGVGRVLDVGMGTGWMTNRLTNFFPEAKVIGMDSAAGMIEASRKKYNGIQAVQADARMIPFRPEAFDIVISNLAYQWVGDPLLAFREASRVLKEDGVLCLTMFGYGTLPELFESFCAVKGEEVIIKRLSDGESIREALRQAQFKDIELDKETIKAHFPDMLSLIKWLKDIGANILPKNGFVGKETMLEANEFYKKNFSDRLGVTATFEVLWIKARK